MGTGWERAATIAVAVAALAASALTVGCGPAPGYEREPRVPMGYAPVGESTAQPATSEELQARAEARQGEAGGEGDMAIGADANEYADTDPSALTEFKPALEGHGTWVDDATYGTLWVPAEAEVGKDFVPYTTAGHWTYADDASWVWVSDYSWGWAPFHYGRWVNVRRHGWAWIPGRTYAGAWVTWRYGAGYDYVGWSPAPPQWYWYNGFAAGWTFGYAPYYAYCHRDYLYSPRLGSYVVGGSDPRAREHEGRTRPYVAARPSAGGGGRVAASPTVGGGDRVAASPTVGGGDRVAASPSVGGGDRVAASPGVGGGAGGDEGRVVASPGVGPRPTEIGIRPDTVVAPPVNHAGLSRAHALASPSTAVAQGAAAPSSVLRRRVERDAISAAPSARGEGGRSPAVSRPFEAAARAPQVQGVTPVAPRPFSAPSAFDARSSSRAFGSPSTPGLAASPGPAYRAPPPLTPPSSSFGPERPPSSFSQGSPAYRSSPPSFSQAAPSFRSSPPSFSQAAPSFRSSPPSFSQASPSFRSPSPSFSQPSPSFRSPGPSFRSPSPSVSPPSQSFRSPAQPSFRSPTPSSPSRSSGAALRRR